MLPVAILNHFASISVVGEMVVDVGIIARTSPVWRVVATIHVTAAVTTVTVLSTAKQVAHGNAMDTSTRAVVVVTTVVALLLVGTPVLIAVGTSTRAVVASGLAPV
jgi:hypothetical protein